MAKQHDVKPEPEMKSEEPAVAPSASEAELDGAQSLERIAVALERLADRYAPVATVRSMAGSLSRLKQCANGHAMQPTDDYCQECHRSRYPKVPTGNDAA